MGSISDFSKGRIQNLLGLYSRSAREPSPVKGSILNILKFLIF